MKSNIDINSERNISKTRITLDGQILHQTMVASPPVLSIHFLNGVMTFYFVTSSPINQSHGWQTSSKVIACLNKGHQLPINWVNFYAYFDEQLNDPQNRYLSYLKNPEIAGDDFEPSTSVEKLLNQYRDSLLSTYDII